MFEQVADTADRSAWTSSKRNKMKEKEKVSFLVQGERMNSISVVFPSSSLGHRVWTYASVFSFGNVTGRDKDVNKKLNTVESQLSDPVERQERPDEGIFG